MINVIPFYQLQGNYYLVLTQTDLDQGWTAFDETSPLCHRQPYQFIVVCPSNNSEQTRLIAFVEVEVNDPLLNSEWLIRTGQNYQNPVLSQKKTTRHFMLEELLMMLLSGLQKNGIIHEETLHWGICYHSIHLDVSIGLGILELFRRLLAPESISQNLMTWLSLITKQQKEFAQYLSLSMHLLHFLLNKKEPNVKPDPPQEKITPEDSNLHIGFLKSQPFFPKKKT